MNSVAMDNEVGVNTSQQVRHEDGEYEDTRNRTNSQIIREQKKKIKEQDEDIDEIIGVTKRIQGEAQNFKSEATVQNKMLD
jgi:hypothetical protein